MRIPGPSGQHRARLKSTDLEGPADLAIEIVSPESGPRDRGEKFYEYEAGGVREYWLIDPERRQMEVYVLGATGRYGLRCGGGEGVYRSEVLAGFWVSVEELWQEPLPPVLQVVRELGLIGPPDLALHGTRWWGLRACLRRVASAEYSSRG